jgi:ketosteroid isomerase-like protein
VQNSSGNSLEERMRSLEDRLAIYQLVAGYGYAVDGCNADAVGSFYAEGGSYAVGDVGTFRGREQIAGITSQSGHRNLVGNGCGHVSTLPYVVIDNDRATATCHTMLIKRGKDGFCVDRLSASRLELSRKPDGGWQIEHRQNYMLNGDPKGPALLARLDEAPTNV